MKQQFNNIQWNNFYNGYYEPIPASPFDTGYNRAQSGLAIAGQLRPGDLGTPTGTLDVIFTSDFTDGLSFRDLGTSKIRFTNSDVYQIGGSAVKGLASILINDDIEIYGLNKSTPLLIEAGLANNSGINWITSVDGPILKLQNIIIKGSQFAGILASTSTDAYERFDLKFIRVFGLNTEGEGVYIGNTSTTFAVTNEVDIQHYYVTDKGRDGLQIGHTNEMYVNKFTCYDVGKTNTAQQDHLIQVVDTNGLIENSVFDYAPRICNLSAHGVTIRNCYFRFYDTAESGGFIGRTDNLSYYPTARHNGEPILFENCYFDDDSGISAGALFNVQERIADIEFRSCSFDTTKSNLFLDTRVVGYTNTLIGTLTTNGNSIIALTPPTYSNHISTSYEDHGLITNEWFLNKHMGYRTR